jgi:phosphinothricin acetyltransferase
MSETGIVRTALAADAGAIADIYTESILMRDSTMDTEPWSEDRARELLTNLSERESVVVLETGDGVIGWGIVKSYSDRPGYRVACETSLYLYRAQTGRGYGSAIQRELHRRCREFGYHHVVAKIWASNASSIAMHRKHGFTLVGIQKEIGRIDGAWRDIALMQCLLDDPAAT